MHTMRFGPDYRVGADSTSLRIVSQDTSPPATSIAAEATIADP